jgi:eukaryotic-like serine/threonine-protein kinase
MLLDRISVGGMAEVFRATDRDHKLVAIKRILPSVAEDVQFIKMFVAEARTASQLQHPNICQIFELGRTEGTHFIAMEHIWGKDLLQIRNRMRKLRQPMPIPITAYILARACDGLDYAHKRKDPIGRPLELVHRDMSPHNVLVAFTGDVKVIDFGIARVKSRINKPSKGQLKGKFAYMAPEQVLSAPLDRRTDIFALGIVLYELVTGERMFATDSDIATLEKVRTLDYRPARELSPGLPAAMEQILDRTLAKDPVERFQWCSELGAELDRFAAGIDQSVLSAWVRNLFAKEVAAEREAIDPDNVFGLPALVVAQPDEEPMDVDAFLAELSPSEVTQSGAPDFPDVERESPSRARGNRTIPMPPGGKR